jgi:uncharacterized membrane protein (DUF485 family)
MADTARNVGKDMRVGHKTVHEIIESPDFKQLVTKRWTVSSILLVLLFVTYYGYVVLVGTNRELLAQKVGEVTTLGIPVGVAVIVIAFVLTAYYVVWANSSYDPEVDRLKGQLKK